MLPTLTTTNTPLPTATATPKPPETLLEYTDALGIDFGGATAIAYFQDWQPEHEKMYPYFMENFNLFQDGWDGGVWTNHSDTIFRPSINEFNFSDMDKYVKFVQKNKLSSQLCHLIWGYKGNLPEWLLNGGFTEIELLAILENHIGTVVSRYKGEIKSYSVVNEILNFPWETEQRFWSKQLDKKSDWVKKCFKWANEADPNAILFLNDASIEFPDSYAYVPSRDDYDYQLIRNMKDTNIPIHGVGFQMHLNTFKDFYPNKDIALLMDGLYNNIEKYRNLGIDVYVTEFDVGLAGLKQLTLDEKYALQAKVYGSVLDTCLSAGVKSFTIFNLIDRLSWLESPENPPYSGKDANPCPWDDNYQPKPAYYAMLDVMKKHYAQKTSG